MHDKNEMGEQQGAGQGEAKMEDSRVSEANRALVVNTLCLMSQEYIICGTLYHILLGRGGCCCLLRRRKWAGTRWLLQWPGKGTFLSLEHPHLAMRRVATTLSPWSKTRLDNIRSPHSLSLRSKSVLKTSLSEALALFPKLNLSM